MKYPHDYMDLQTSGDTESETPRKISNERLASKALKLSDEINKFVYSAQGNHDAKCLTDYVKLFQAVDHLADLNKLLLQNPKP
jgi:predicted HAD superfamily Cof-like phosphohydrolase